MGVCVFFLFPSGQRIIPTPLPSGRGMVIQRR
ncbi:hypothetical protein [Vibrio phage vB_pir03]|nr:hypothetical protein [Vibrio phage vB_pir03]